MEDIKRILAVSWMTQYCQKTVHCAVSLAGKYGAELSVIHVIDKLWAQGWNLPIMSQAEERRKDVERIRAALDNIIGGETDEGEKIKKIIEATTADLYVHVPPQVDQEAADRTAEYIFGTVPRRDQLG